MAGRVAVVVDLEVALSAVPARAVLTGGLVLVAIGLERLLNAYMLAGTAEFEGRIALGLTLAAGGVILLAVGAVVVGRPPPGGCPGVGSSVGP
jgi:hypothetical protein